MNKRLNKTMAQFLLAGQLMLLPLVGLGQKKTQTEIKSSPYPYDTVVVAMGRDPFGKYAIKNIAAGDNWIDILGDWAMIYAQDSIHTKAPYVLGNSKEGFSKYRFFDFNADGANILLHLSQHGNVVESKDSASKHKKNRVHMSTINDSESGYLQTTDMILSAAKGCKSIDVIIDNCKGGQVCHDLAMLEKHKGPPILPIGSIVVAFTNSEDDNFASISNHYLEETALYQNKGLKENFLFGSLVNYIAQSTHNDLIVDRKISFKPYSARMSIAVSTENGLKTFDVDAETYAEKLNKKPKSNKELNVLKQKCHSLFETLHLENTPLALELNVLASPLVLASMAQDVSTAFKENDLLAGPDRFLSALLLFDLVESGAAETMLHAKQPQQPTQSPTLKP